MKYLRVNFLRMMNNGHQEKKKKKTCNGCRAESFVSYQNGCVLGYNPEPVITMNVIVAHTPIIRCPKPLTYVNFIRAKVHVNT